MKSLQVFFLVLIFSITGLSAQGLAGSYKLQYKGKQVSSNSTQTVRQVNGSSTLEITQNGDDITVTMGDSGQGLWSANRMSGQGGTKRFVAVLVNGSKSVYTITGTVVNGQIRGTYSYLRYGNRSTGIVPGWTRVQFTAKK
ncbi:MAG: hypothetical protein AAFY45_23535 [Bacteroidota bacterium]